MRMVFIVGLLALVCFSFSYDINPAYQCPGHESDCILIGGSPCHYTTGPDCQGSYQEFAGRTDYWAWIGDQCFCPYQSSAQAQTPPTQAQTPPTQADCPPSDCIMIGNTPCYLQSGVPGCVGTYKEFAGVTQNWAWISNECYCPYPGNVPKDKCAGKNCGTRTCSGTTVKNPYCDPQTGDCKTDTGYCQNGCNSQGTDCGTSVTTPKGYKQDDQTCDTPKGENCDNSRNDCACQSGWTCNPSAANARDDGCAPATPFSCTDTACEISKGEMCSSCGGNDAPCACGNYETCNPGSSGSDSMGCIETADSPCKLCPEQQCVDKTDIDGATRSFSATKTTCISGQCIFSMQECIDGCVSSTGRCSAPVSVSPGGCVDDGTYIITKNGASGSNSVRRDPITGDPSVVTVGDRDKHCAGDLVVTDSSTKIWIKHKSGRMTYVGPNSIYENGKARPNMDVASGEIQEQNTVNSDPGAVTDDEKGIVTLVPYQIAADIQKGTDYAGKPLVGNLRSLMDPRLDFEKKTDVLFSDILADYLRDYYGVSGDFGNRIRSPSSSFYVKQHSNVLYQIDDTGTRITVLEGEATVIDDMTNQSINVSKGEQYVKPVGVPPAQGTKTVVPISSYHDNISDAPGSCCMSAIVLGLLMAGMFWKR